MLAQYGGHDVPFARIRAVHPGDDVFPEETNIGTKRAARSPLCNEIQKHGGNDESARLLQTKRHARTLIAEVQVCVDLPTFLDELRFPLHPARLLLLGSSAVLHYTGVEDPASHCSPAVLRHWHSRTTRMQVSISNSRWYIKLFLFSHSSVVRQSAPPWHKGRQRPAQHVQAAPRHDHKARIEVPLRVVIAQALCRGVQLRLRMTAHALLNVQTNNASQDKRNQRRLRGRPRAG
ncbi:hypothetical protein LSCM4_03179 [Leishmania orientalis]|uniref:Uncharacterized protein n=1 Tax=Leishmania orientalis TaxID=2249476 RepID=A0A836H7R0_9TRYP|nr:hypothetical protein LSCM4_03179 [Leishmania orientalis]